MPEPHLRAADADRAAVAEVLGTHMSTGRLTVEEYDDRLARAYAARTYGELDELTTDLPPLAPAPAAGTPVDPAPQPATATATAAAPAGWGPWGAHGWHGGLARGVHGAGLRAAWASWLTTAVIVVGIWALTSLGSGDWIYPWPMWVIGPWGIVLLAQTLGGGSTGGPGRDRQRNRDRHRTHPAGTEAPRS